MADKTIDLTKMQFTGKSGTIYHIDYDIARGRSFPTEILGLGLAFENGWIGYFNLLSKIFNLSTSGSDPIMNLSQIAYTTAETMATINQRLQFGSDLYVTLCTIITYSEGEDRTKWDEALCKKKIEDWSEYSDKDFFHLAVIGFPGLATLVENLSSVAEMMKKTITAITGLTNPTTQDTSEKISKGQLTTKDLLELSWTE